MQSLCSLSGFPHSWLPFEVSNPRVQDDTSSYFSVAEQAPESKQKTSYVISLWMNNHPLAHVELVEIFLTMFRL